MEQLVHILHLEDDVADAELVQAMLESAGVACQITRVQTHAEFAGALQEGGFDAILADFRLPSFSGMSALRLAQEQCPDIPFIFVSGTMGEDAAIEGLTQGATDYVLKQKMSRLGPAIKRALREAENQRARKRAEESLRESEERFRRLAENAQDVIYRYRLIPQPCFEYVNPAVNKMLGYSPEECYTDPALFMKTLHPDDLPLINAAMRGEIELEPLSVLRWVRKDGSIVWIEQRHIPIFDQAGNLLAIEGVARDITERKRLEETLEKERQELELIIDTSPIIVFYKDKEGRFIRVNKTFAEAIAMSREDLVGKTVFDLYSPKIAQGMVNDDQEVLESGRAKLDIIEQYESAGGTRWVQTDKFPILDKNGIPVSLIGFAQDITERKRAEEEIQRHVRHLAILHEIDQALTSTLDLDQVLSTLLEQVQRAADAEAASVALVEAGTGALVFRQAMGGASQDVIGLRLEPGQGIAGWVALHQQSVLASDAAADPRFYAGVDSITGFTTRDVVCVPLRIRNTVTGVIELVNKRQGRYSEDEVQLLESVAAQAAVTMENARLFEAEHVGRQRLETLYRIGQAINSTLDAGVILDRLTDEAMRATHATHGSALVALADLGHFERRSLRGYSPEQAEKAHTVPLLLNEGVNGQAYQTRRIAYRSDVQTDPDYFPLIPETRSELAVPILRGGQVLGNLDLQSPEADAFRDVDLGLLQALTDQVAIALENARLFEAERRRLEEMSIISDVALAGATGQPFDETVARATRNLSRLWPEADCGFLFLDEADQSLHVHPSYHGLQPESIASQRIPLSQGLIGWAARERQPVRVGDVTADPRYVRVVDAVRSEMAAPLIADDHIIGVVNVYSHRLNAFSQDDLLLLTTLAGQLATLFEKARLDAALEQERASLARRVEERTADLNIANAGLRQAARAKDEFLASMSHELRTPLNAILGLSEALQEQVFGPLNEKQLRYLHTIEESGRHLLALINDILDLAKVEAGKVELQISRVVIESACQASLQFIKEAAHRKHVLVSSSLDSRVSTMQADERRLKQILVNLLSNAVKFTPEGGEVGLEVLGNVEQQIVHFIVWDTGIGISRENIERLFQPFVQLDSSLSRQYPGTGLGLSLVKRLAELHGGSVSAESEVGKGSRFTVSLPWQMQREEKRVASDEERVGKDGTLDARHSASVAVLLVEDSETNLTSMSDYLSAKGYRVIIARNGSEAIRRAVEDRPDVVLMDIQMPGMDGLEAIRHIRAEPDPRVAQVPIIALTAIAMSGDRQRCMEAGANEYLSKPVSLKELVKVIEAQLREV